MEEREYWREPNDKELDAVRSVVHNAVGYNRKQTETKFVFFVFGAFFAFGCFDLIFIRDDNGLPLTVFSLICMSVYYLVFCYRRRKQSFMVKRSEEGRILVRDMVVNKTECVRSINRSHGIETVKYYASADISMHDTDVESRRYEISEATYRSIKKGSRFLDVRFDPDLDGKPYLIIEQVWNID